MEDVKLGPSLGKTKNIATDNREGYRTIEPKY